MKNHLFKHAAVFCSALLALVSCRKEEEKPGTAPQDKVELEIALVEAGQTNASFSVSVKYSDTFAWFYTSDPEQGGKMLSSDFVYQNGNVEESAEEPKVINVDGLTPDTDYWFFASAINDCSDVTDSIRVHTEQVPVIPPISAGEVTKTSLSYHINSEPGCTYRHAYIEGWYFNHLLASSMEDEGSDFDMNVFLWNLLATFGVEGTQPADYTWANDQENTIRNQEVTLYGGQSYFAIFSYIDGETDWTGTPEYVELTLPEAGSISGKVNFTDEEVKPNRIKARMQFSDNDYSYICYDLYKKDAYDAKFNGENEKRIKDFLYEYALHAGNTYTDTWSVESDTEYILAIMGVDHNGDSFLQTKVYTTPEPAPELNVTLSAYDKELEGYHGYNTARADVTMKNFKNLDTESVFATLMGKAQWDATCMAIFGEMSIDEILATMPEYMAYVVNTPLQENEAEDLQSKGAFSRIASDLEPETEYIFAILFNYNGEWYFKSATATLDAEPSTGDDASYKAFLGEWTVNGKTTKDWKSPLTYTIRIEELTPNSSFKVTGWSSTNAGQQFPFVAKYDAASKKIVIDGFQYLGKTTIGGSEYEVRLMACLSYSGTLYMSDYDGVIYKGNILDAGNGTERLSMFPEFFQRDNKYYEVQTMAYGFMKDGKIAGSPDEYDIVDFQITRQK